MRFLVAPNAFKGSLSAADAARAFRAGVLSVFPRARTEILPISDGGDGFLDFIAAARGGRRVSARAAGPLGEKRAAPFILKGRTAYVEMALASGLALVPPSRRDPLKTSSRGTGDLIAAALRRGARLVVVGLGGSASHDGGAGMAQALGFRLLDSSGRELEPGAAALLRLARIEAPRGLRRRLSALRVVGISDVETPLLGPGGSAERFGPQKGASPAGVRVLQKALRRLADTARRDIGRDASRLPRSGAAGGLGAGLYLFLGAELRGGSAWAIRESRLGARLYRADAVLTGEGRLDKTSFLGKAPIELARLAKARGVPAVFVCGSHSRPLSALRAPLQKAGVAALASLKERAGKRRDPMRGAFGLARAAARLAVQRLFLASALLATGAFRVSAHPHPSLPPRGEGIGMGAEHGDFFYFHRNAPGNLEKCLREIESGLSRNPGDPALLWRKGRALIRRGEKAAVRARRIRDFESAKKVLSRAASVKSGPADGFEIHYWLGLAYGFLGQESPWKGFLYVGPLKREMRQAESLDPRNGRPHRVLGELDASLPRALGGGRDRALAEFQAAFRLSPRDSSAGLALAQAYLAGKDPASARAALRGVLAIKSPEDPAEFADNRKEALKLLAKISKK